MTSSVSFFSSPQLVKYHSDNCPEKVILSELKPLPFIATYMPSGKTHAVCEKLLKQMRNWTCVFKEPLTAHQFEPLSLYWRPFSTSIDIKKMKSQLESAMAYCEMFLKSTLQEGDGQMLRYGIRQLVGIDLWMNAFFNLLDQEGGLNLDTLETLLDSWYEPHRAIQERQAREHPYPSYVQEHIEDLIQAAKENRLDLVKNLLLIQVSHPKTQETIDIPVTGAMLYHVIKNCIQDENRSTTDETMRVLLDRLMNIYVFNIFDTSEKFAREKSFELNKHFSFVPRLIDGVVNARVFAERKDSSDSDSITIHYVSDENFENLASQGCCLHTSHPLYIALENLKTTHANQLSSALETGNVEVIRRLAQKKVADLVFWTTLILSLLIQNEELNFERLQVIANALETVQNSLSKTDKLGFLKIGQIGESLKTCIANRDVIGTRVSLERIATQCLQEFALILSMPD